MRYLFLLILILILSACAFTVTPIGSGAYVVRPYISETPFPIPTEEFPVPSPIPTSNLPTPTPPQPEYICPLGTTGVNVRPVASTSSTPLFVLQPGQRMLMATSLKFDWYEVVYKGTAAYIHKSVSTKCSTGVLIS